MTEMAAFSAVLPAGGWTWGMKPDARLLATASGAAFAAVVIGQLANAFACRSNSRPVFRLKLLTNPLLLFAMTFEATVLAGLLFVPPLAHQLGGNPPNVIGWMFAFLAAPAVLGVDTAAKALARRKLVTSAQHD